jgi:predicted HTH domain antitoxin
LLISTAASSFTAAEKTMKTMTLEYPDELLAALGKRADDAADEIRLMAALKLYEAGRLSSGMAAQLAGMARVEFLLACGRYGVSVFQQSDEELTADLTAALDACAR